MKEPYTYTDLNKLNLKELVCLNEMVIELIKYELIGRELISN